MAEAERTAVSKAPRDPYRDEIARREKEHEAEDLAVIEQHLREGNPLITYYAQAYCRSDAVPKILYRLWKDGVISTDQLESMILDVWQHNKSPVRGLGEPGLGERKWLEMFKAIGFRCGWYECRIDGQSVEPEYELITEQPTEPLTLWRGASLQSKGRGMSWSVHRECALSKFAQPYADIHGEAGLFSAVVPPKAMLAVFGDWREEEVVCNPNMLCGRVRLVERVVISPEAVAGRERLSRLFDL
jgi:hypothetical protein